MAIFSQQFPEGIVYQGLWPIFIAEQSVTRKEPFIIDTAIINKQKMVNRTFP
ncbi:hypothetical protein [Endozoicomonas sp. SCSIO W0465]|uniref:hypothetical protein n=1 Tax=Endozoicomonas sp. SCSIO W0465 TaxID=2918516 RepID=UPI002074BBFB|nr:hypothetical protein [Endozoicomonas sp. SCSIO W0465]USE35694.1 hypothetical protein MJO57_27095 [Endozoicomonas sp. SCSIO W0465]